MLSEDKKKNPWLEAFYLFIVSTKIPLKIALFKVLNDVDVVFCRIWGEQSSVDSSLSIIVLDFSSSLSLLNASNSVVLIGEFIISNSLSSVLNDNPENKIDGDAGVFPTPTEIKVRIYL
jgi:hypothetical protein